MSAPALRFIVSIPADFVPEDGDAFDALVDALEFAEIPAHVVEAPRGDA